MLFKSFTLIASLLITFAAATPARRGEPNQCNTGPIQCCNSIQSADSPSLTPICDSLGINVESLTGLVGVDCSPVTVAGVGGNSCSSDPVCCQNNSFNGVIAVGCVPITINL